MPGPSEVANAIVDGIKDSSLIIAIRISLTRLLFAFTASLLVGTAFGLTMGTVPLVRKAISPVALGMQTLPSICWQPLAILWFGLTEKSILFVTFMGALLAVTISVSDGVRNIPPIYMRAASMMGARGLRMTFRVLFPAALPAIISGSKQGWAFAWRSLMAGELLSVSSGSLGLGQVLMRGRDNNDMSLVLAVIFVMIAIGMVADRLIFTRLEQNIYSRWGLTGA